jgi:hypothetical protein
MTNVAAAANGQTAIGRQIETAKRAWAEPSATHGLSRPGFVGGSDVPRS